MNHSVFFNVEFKPHKQVLAPTDSDAIICDFCKKGIMTYWCEFLVTGYCEKCMEEQIAEYAEFGGGKK